MGIREIVETFALPTGLEALLLGKEVIAANGYSFGKVKKVEVDLSQNKLRMLVGSNFAEIKELLIEDIQFINHKIIRLGNGAGLVNELAPG